ncbi:MAG: 2-oxoglutarate synthase subunit alpha [Deltaproteobacteria bacterium RBG_19FT_COMBO_46_12]|nr:MAG: 2-oxoglutarate synthase subunit alpha [Deltaproteobacteria bacterium RBG_19FT_COMBO_46_12]
MVSRWTKTPFPKGTHYFSGNEAAAEGAMAAGCRFYAGYPITPSSEIMERMAFRLREVGGVFIQMEDEIASISAVIGASWAGAKAMTATSGPGFSLMQESIGYAAFTEAPCVIIDVQRAGPCTGQATRVGSGDIMQAKWGSHGDYQVIALSPWSVQEMYELTLLAFNLSERYRVPTLVMADEAVGHLRENLSIRAKVEVWDRKKKRGGSPFGTEEQGGVPPMPAFGEGERLLVTGSTHDALGFRKTDDPEVHARLVDRINQKILKNRSRMIETEGYFLEDSEKAVMAYGFTARTSLYAVNHLRKEGMKIGMLRLKTLWPFPEEAVTALGRRVKKVIVPEMNLGQVAGEVKKFCSCEVISLSQTDGEVIRPEKILGTLKKI